MKKLLLLAITATGISLMSYGQINKGTVLLGGSIGINTSTNDQGSSTQKSQSYNFSPSVGLAIRTNTILGIGFGYGHYKTKYDPASGNSENTSYGSHLFVRKYKALGNSFFLVGEARIGYGNYKSEQSFVLSTDKVIQKQDNLFINLTPGIAYVVNKHIHLEGTLNSLASLQYSSNKNYNTTSPNNVSKGSSFGFQSNISSNNPLNLGIRFLLGK